MYKLFFVSHRLMGLIAGLHFALLGLSGSYLVYSDFFDKVLFSYRYELPEEFKSFNIEEVIVDTQRIFETSDAPVRIKVPTNHKESIQIAYNVKTKGKRAETIIGFYDPVKKEIMDKVDRKESLNGIMFSFHHDLFLGRTGRLIMGVSGVLCMLILLTGLYLWWPRKKRFKQAFFKWRRKTFLAFTLDGHKLLGFYTSALMIMVTFTGLYITVPQWFTLPAARKEEVAKVRTPDPTRILENQNEILTQAYLSAGKKEELMRGANFFFHPRAKKLFFTMNGETRIYNPEKNEFKKQERKGESSLRRTMGQLHEGHFWGELGLFLVFLSGVLSILFYISGIYLWVKKSKMRWLRF